MKLRERWQSFVYAWQGGLTLWRTQPNARLHLVATAVVVAASAWFRISAAEWLAVAGAIALVWITEALNTALEFLADEVTRERRAGIGRAKDVAAFAVLAASAAAVAVGGVVFLPRLLALR